MQGKWFINSKDTYATWKVAILKGSYSEIMSPPKPRKRLEHAYTDKNGIDVDTTTPLTFEPYRYKIKILIVGNNFEDFWSNYNAFFNEISTPKSFTLKVEDLAVTVNVFYEGARNIDKQIVMKKGKVVCSYEINVLENNPKDRIYG